MSIFLKYMEPSAHFSVPARLDASEDGAGEMYWADKLKGTVILDQGVLLNV